jgi:hypothetical protein
VKLLNVESTNAIQSIASAYDIAPLVDTGMRMTATLNFMLLSMMLHLLRLHFSQEMLEHHCNQALWLRLSRIQCFVASQLVGSEKIP